MNNDISIDELLAQRKTRRVGNNGSHADALRRLDISKLLAKNFEGFHTLRNHLLHADRFHSIRRPSRQVTSAIGLLKDLGWVRPAHHPGTWALASDLSADIRWYLQGGWLEEYVYCASLEAGADEAFYGQPVEWQVGDVTGKNEIDVIARRGDTLSFTSCKTQHPHKQGAATALLSFLTEADYWDTHFADNKGKVLLVVTADFIDEIEQNRHRYPVILARASILDVEMIGLEDLGWERLVERINEHWSN